MVNERGLASDGITSRLTVVHVPPGTTCNEAVAARDSAAVMTHEKNRILNSGSLTRDRNDEQRPLRHPFTLSHFIRGISPGAMVAVRGNNLDHIGGLIVILGHLMGIPRRGHYIRDPDGFLGPYEVVAKAQRRRC